MFKLISGKKHVFIDWIGVEAGYGTRAPESKKPNFTPSGVKLSVHKPVLEKEAVMIPDKRWEQFCINAAGMNAFPIPQKMI